MVYKESSVDEVNAFIKIDNVLTEWVNALPEWTKHKKPGRPRKMAAHLKASSDLVSRLKSLVWMTPGFQTEAQYPDIGPRSSGLEKDDSLYLELPDPIREALPSTDQQ